MPKVILIAMKIEECISSYVVCLNQFAPNHPVVRVASIFMSKPYCLAIQRIYTYTYE